MRKFMRTRTAPAPPPHPPPPPPPRTRPTDTPVNGSAGARRDDRSTLSTSRYLSSLSSLHLNKSRQNVRKSGAWEPAHGAAPYAAPLIRRANDGVCSRYWGGSAGSGGAPPPWEDAEFPPARALGARAGCVVWKRPHISPNSLSMRAMSLMCRAIIVIVVCMRVVAPPPPAPAHSAAPRRPTVVSLSFILFIHARRSERS
ncbi:hypothetical protein MSG28_012916 [Choristoneura fumiferana]|uniref:Uncharacterized protein n=1 Tax=Choristoneura fumiferana TaxID=7141 RepID=A0ACC0KRT4_CHOFU|nr:hypothetical protein MSG28_012916 [Choristoneura fumiferana]